MEAITEDKQIVRRLADLEAVLAVSHHDAHGVSIVQDATRVIQSYRSLIVALENEIARLKEARSLLEIAEVAIRTQHTPPSNWLTRARLFLTPEGQHVWDADGDHCTKCGASDWMAGGCNG